MYLVNIKKKEDTVLTEHARSRRRSLPRKCLTRLPWFLISDETGQFLVKDPWYAGDSYEFSSLLVNAKRYTCTCGKFYSQKSSLDRHLRYECGKMPNVPCPQCGKMFKHKHHVTQHLKSCRLKDPTKTDFPNY